MENYHSASTQTLIFKQTIHMSPNIANTYFVVDAEIEFLIAGSNCHLCIRIWIISCARFEHKVAVVFETSYQPQILYATHTTFVLCPMVSLGNHLRHFFLDSRPTAQCDLR